MIIALAFTTNIFSSAVVAILHIRLLLISVGGFDEETDTVFGLVL